MRTIAKFRAYCSKKTTFVKTKGISMNITTRLLYLLLLYAVLDKDNKLSLTTGLIIAFVILLLNCWFNRCCNNNNNGLTTTTTTTTTNGTNVFSTLNGF